MTTVHVTGTGVISAMGNSWPEHWYAFQHEQTGIGRLTLFDSIHQGVLPVGEVKLSNRELCERLEQPTSSSRTILLGIHAAREALQQSSIDRLSHYRVGFISATTVGGMDRTENFFPLFLHDLKGGRLREVVDHACGKSTERIAEALGIKGFLSTVNTACSSSVNSIILGARLIRNNMLDIVVAGGTDALTQFTLNGFNSLMILDKEPCRPFDASRNGLNLGEGAGYVVLVSQQVLRDQGLESLAVVSGYGNTNDAYHQTASSPEGRGSYAAMKEALRQAQLQEQDIDYINLHGTGTLNNDLSEGTAIKRLFEARMPKVSSTKTFTGHTLGACGGIEAVFSIMSLKHQIVFPNLRFVAPMPEVGIVPQQRLEQGMIKHVMSNSFGFGGNCSSVVFSAPVTSNE